MRSPEEVAREIRRLTWDVLGNDGLVEEDGPALADVIRARDAEIREATIAEIELRVVADLSELTWQTAECEEEMEQDGWGCHYDMHCSLPKTERIQVRPGVYENRDPRPRRLVGPWVKP